MIERAVIIVLDGVGVGASADAAAYGDAGADSLGHTAQAVGGLHLPNMARLGLGNIGQFEGLPPDPAATGAYGRMAEASAGKDTVTGHWEMVGVITHRPPPVYPHGFPPEIIEAFSRSTGRGVLGNKPASGTAIIAELGDEHVRTGKLIVYTSADSVFQIAAHEDVVPLPELYRACELARELLSGEHAVGRVIARPFTGKPPTEVGDQDSGAGRCSHYTRDNEARRDWALAPPGPHLLDLAAGAGLEVQGIGKIQDIFAGRSITSSTHVLNNEEAIAATLEALRRPARGIVFSNLIEFDMVYGHRKDPHGYAGALRRFDDALPALQGAMGAGDVLFITGDHGVDPCGPGTDHTREYVPLLVTGKPVRGVDLGTRATFADLGATIAGLLGLPPLGGTILGAGRLNPAREGDEHLSEVVEAVSTLNLTGLIVIGDSGGLAAAYAVAKHGVHIVGVPGTMDNDVGGTDYCIGYDSAVSTVAEAIDKLQTTASAHHRVMVVEAMGRDTGWVALAGALCGSAHMVVVPEVSLRIDELVQRLHARHDAGHTFTVVVVAEGAAIDGLPAAPAPPAGSIAARLAQPSVGELVGLELEARTGYETRVTVLGHLQRGGSPTVYDRLMATRFGATAVDLAAQGRWNHMVALKGGQIVAVPLQDAGRRRPAGLDLYEMATLFSGQ